MSEHNGLATSSASVPAPVAAPVSQEQQLLKHEDPTTTQAAHATVTTAPPSTVAATAAAATAAVGAAPANGTASPGESLACEWGQCGQVLPNAEALYEHICERHVGRKSTNNLNLTCAWGSCRTTTVKRDHITSHIRVHVPLKPHKCSTCGKAFKRPQDLKKHVKTHADDTVLMQSPEPAARHHPDMMFGGAPRGYPHGHYFEQLNPVPSQGYAPSGHYFPPPHAPQPNSYGNVYYTLNQGPDANHGSYESKKRGYDALNEFFGDLKRRQFDTNSYAALGQRLMGIQGLQLPMLNGGAEYHTMPTPVAVGGGGGGGYSAGPQPASAYQLPPMSNARTKDDLLALDHVLEQMQNTIYESDENLQASGVGQPGAHFLHGAMSYRSANSPPTQLPRSHVTAPPTAAPALANVTAAQSPSIGTPALTPPSSAQSFTSGRSPVSVPAAHHASPIQSEGSSGMYPRLPAATVSDGMAAGYATATSTAPPSTLGGIFDHDDRRRYTGGTLQRARPLERRQSDEMDISQSVDGERTPIAKEQASKSALFSSSLIDPALHSAMSNDSENTQRTAQAATEVTEKADTKWVEKARRIEFLRSWLCHRLERGDFEAMSLNQNASFGYGDAMEGVESGHRHESSSDSVMYPTLQMADEEGDAQMK